ncbi:MAG: SUMF1/EgtB/PvdO family nonheme iron enzyme, partial [Planctomycetaceae bacterium]|nr:SUMF1/EgtB/PvdO family nonheme iron enzyme [Planctomycetaceae bacterium]
MEFKLIPAGTFVMGSPDSEEGRDDDERQHEVTITRDFYMGVTEVTQSQWQQVMGTTPW